MAKMGTLGWIATVLVIVGALNWGLVGLFSFNLVTELANLTFAMLEPIVYVAVGISGVYSGYALYEANN